MAEAIVAMFVLLGGFTVLFRLFHTAVHYSNIVDSRQNKVRIALNKIEEIRAWSQSVHQPVGSEPFDDTWLYWNDKIGTDDENPEIQWKVKVLEHVLYSPCQSFEAAKLPGQRRQMERSSKQIVVKVNDGNPEGSGLGVSHQPVVLTTLIGQPSIDPAAAGNFQVNVAGADANLGHDGSAGPYTATLSTAGKEILDVFFHWDSLGDAAGTIKPTGAGTARQVTVTHIIKVPDGTNIYSVPGRCKAYATCKFRGYTFVNANAPAIDLHDP
ncbi:hypothetical protein ABS71_05600 [bacterium SCN 62-11]|nr:MAG: hypothetical protein ABS71_05600 [bacterium SCN 62-11]